MLDLESRQDILGITGIRDADNAEQFYHLPGAPKISRDAGGPMFDLMTYRTGGKAGQTVAGGFLTMTVDVGLGELGRTLAAHELAKDSTAEISAPGVDTTTVALRKDTPSRTLTMRKPLSELVAGNAAGIQTATYRVRNNYVDHHGQWTEAQQQSGQELFVYPNPAPGD